MNMLIKKTPGQSKIVKYGGGFLAAAFILAAAIGVFELLNPATTKTAEAEPVLINQELVRLAKSGDYIAQRELSAQLEVTAKKGIEGAADAACAWRTVLVTSNHAQAVIDDIHKFLNACGALDKTSLVAANLMAGAQTGLSIDIQALLLKAKAHAQP